MNELQLVIVEHAYKHGLSEEEIRCAWESAYVKFARIDDVRGEVIAAFGPAQEGAFVLGIRDCVGVVGRREGGLVFIFHASRPPVPTLRKELEDWRKDHR